MRRVLLLLLMLITCKFADATHIYGGDLLYTHIGGDQYKITLTLYGDCSGSAFPRLHSATPSVRLYKNKAVWSTIDLTEDVSQRKEVSPVCPEEAHNTACRNDGDKSLPGVMMFVYTGTVTFEEGHLWEMVFEGAMGNNTAAGRSNSITNIIFGSSGQVMTLVALLNNINGHNSSPEYTTIPTPFYCINTAQQYNQGAVDPDNDSLYFSLTPALRTQTLTVTYRNPYSEVDPLNTLPSSFTFDSSSGQMDFTPDAIQRSLVVNKVEEYKDGVLVGSSMREMTFIVLNNCDNDPPSGVIDQSTVSGGYMITDYSINVCDIAPEIEFSIPVFDNNNNNINVSITNLPPGAVANIIDNNSKRPVINFIWNPQNPISGNYNIFITYKDDACPLSSSITVAYTIRLADPPNVIHEDIHQCLFDTPLELYANGIQGADINWYNLEGVRYDTKPSYSTDSALTLQWLVNQTVGVCESLKDTITVYIHDTPTIKIINPGGTACYGEGMYLVAEGGTWYEWSPKDKIEMRDDAPYAYITEPGEFVVKGYSEYQCENTATLAFDNILECCHFSYPNAFTPNNDGTNDGWRPISYGDMNYYVLSVYNRWGERIFVSSNPYEEWDGTYKGKPCDVGTYHYFLKATCLSGNQEAVRGTVTLIR